MSELLIELYSEEIPARDQKNAKNGFFQIFKNFFEKQNVEYQDLNVYTSPCRVAIYATRLNIQNQTNFIKGPRTDNIKAVEGFCKKYKIDVEQLSVKTEKNVDYYILNNVPAKTLKQLLEEEICKLISSFVWSKSMRWGVSSIDDTAISWIRPLKNILCILNSEIVEFNYGHLKSNNSTFGHKYFESKQSISSFKEYKEFLYDNHVIFDDIERKNIIIKQVEDICSENNLVLNRDEGLIDEINALVEFPKVLLGSIPQRFMQVPEEILILCLKSHQKYLTCKDKQGVRQDMLSRYFIFVTNLALENYDAIIQGNEKVLAARLSDALYFYTQDLKISLETRLPLLKNVVFHSNIGSVYDKSMRIESICKILLPSNHNLLQAAKLCKCDLITEVVGEFPELQGQISKYYAVNDSLSQEIADAISNHYRPQGMNDAVPKGIGAALSLADKLDTLIALTVAGEVATSSRDPYGLRRNAIGIIRIILSGYLKINLSHIIEQIITEVFKIENKKDELIEFLKKFLYERLKYFLNQTYDHQMVASVISLESIFTLKQKLDFLVNFVQTEEWKVLLNSYKRMANLTNINLISPISEKSSQQSNRVKEQVDENLFSHESEMMLDSSHNIDQSLSLEEKLKSLIAVAKKIDIFFDNVLVNDTNHHVAKNRLNLLTNVKTEFDKVMDFSCYL